jgi:hypothetical protein
LVGQDEVQLSYSTKTPTKRQYKKETEADKTSLEHGKKTQSKKRKMVTIQEDPSSEEERDGDSSEDLRTTTHMRLAEEMLSAVIHSFNFGSYHRN